MLVDLKTILADTREKHYAVGLFNCVTLEMTKGILAAAEELHSPVIIGPAESLLPGASLAEYADMMLGMARRAGVPVALHFDHGFTPELVEEAIRLGFSSVMYDCSMLPFEENVRRTREMTAKADSMLIRPGETMPIHEFNHWDSTANGTAFTACKNEKMQWECGCANENFYAGFPHLYWAGTPLPGRFVRAAERYSKTKG